MSRTASIARSLTISSMIAAAWLSPASAALVVNGSFEDPNLIIAPATIQPNGFTGLSGITTSVNNLGLEPASDGDQIGFVQANAEQGGRIRLDVTGLIIGESYTFSFFAERGTESNVPISFGVDFLSSSGNQLFNDDFGTFTPTTSVVQYDTTPFVAAAAFGTVRFGSQLTNSLVVRTVGLDMVTINQVGGNGGTIPEPATWVMLLAGFGLVGFALRRRRSIRVHYA